MKLSFSTLACPSWTVPEIIAAASGAGYQGIELRFVQNEDSLWKLPSFRGSELRATSRAFADRGLSICCIDTSCRFHSPDVHERRQWLEEGERMSELAAALGAPGIRVFGDRVQPGADQVSTRGWISDSIHQLAERSAAKGVEVWLESHGDFAAAAETMAVVVQAGSQHVGVVWDPANAFTEFQEPPQEGAIQLGARIRHVHFKDLRKYGDNWHPVLTGEGSVPLREVRLALSMLAYERFVSFEWEKKWHPEIPDASTALPHFAGWFRENWAR